MSPAAARFAARLCRLGSVLALAGAAGVGYWGTLPVTLDRSDAQPPKAVGVLTPPRILRLDALQAHLDQRLRPPLYDPPPPPEPPRPVEQPPPPLRVNLRLVGTVLEAGHSKALLAAPDGNIEFRTVGDRFDWESQTLVVEEVSARDTLLHVVAPRDGMVRLNLEEPNPN
jgi:hypothetical protein